MKLLIRVFLLFLATASLQTAHAQIDRLVEVKGSLPSELTARLDSICQAFAAAHYYPGLGVGISTADYDTWMNSYGFANIAEQERIDVRKHLFRVGSVSKLITAIALMGMVEDLQIDIEAPIARYMPGLPPDKGALTIKQLASHTAGIRHYRGFEFYSNLPYNDVFAPLEVFIHDTLLFTPGTQYEYSTYGWTLISAVMEKAAKKPFLQILHDRINKPFRINYPRADQKDSTGYLRVSFYDFRDSLHIISPVVDNSNKWAGGGLLCTVEDLLVIGEGLYNNHIPPGYQRAFTTPFQLPDGKLTDYGLGFRVRTDEKGRTWIGHSGGSIGGTSMLLVFPEHDIAVTTLINMTQADMNSLAWVLADAVLEYLD